MRAAGSQSHGRHDSRIRDRRLLGFKLRTLDPRSCAAHGPIKHPRQRLINHTQHALSFFGQSNLNREVAVAVDEAVGAVERIDHPDARFIQPSFGVDRFFRKDSIVRKYTLQTVNDHLVGNGVSLSYRLDVVSGSLLLDMKRTVVEFENGSARGARKFANEAQFVIVCFVFESARHIKEILTPSRKDAKAVSDAYFASLRLGVSSSATSRMAAIVSSISVFVVRKFVIHARRAKRPFTVAFDRYARPPFCTCSMTRSFN